MVTAAEATWSGGFSAPAALQLSAFLRNVLKYPEFVTALQKANALIMITRMVNRQLTGQLTVREVEEAISSAKGRTLELLPHGRAVLRLLLAFALGGTRDWDGVIREVQHAEKDKLTKHAAASLKALAWESKGETSEADACIKVVATSNAPELLRGLYYQLSLMNIEKGIRALVAGKTMIVESTAQRLLVLDRDGKERGLHDVGNVAFLISRAFLAQDFDKVWEYTGDRRTAAQKAKLRSGMEVWVQRFNEETGGQAAPNLEEFAEFVQLLAIDEPFERWDQLGILISHDWPEGLSAEEAVRQIRE